MRFAMTALCGAALLAASPSHASTADTAPADIADLINKGSAKLALRYRYEGVDDDGFGEDAKASTLRTRLTLESGHYMNFSGLLEFDNISEIVADDFNAGAGNTPDRTEYPVVADPDGTEVNQMYVDYNGIDEVRLRLGRQRITFDNHRFIGNVGWRQNEQTYDAFSTYWQRDNIHVTYAYVDDVRRIFGEEVPAGREEQDNTHLINGRIDLADIGAITGYYYHIDSEDAVATSTSTFGARLSGSRPVDTMTVRYAVEFARQSDAGDNPASFDANYYLLDGGVIIDNFDIGLAWEVLQGNENVAGEAFSTPFATLHAFNGWADKFLGTPSEGLDDRFARAKATFGDFSAELAYHLFEGQDTGDDLGEEWDVSVGYQFHPRIRGDLKLAAFDGEDPRYSDTTKFWVMVSATLP